MHLHISAIPVVQGGGLTVTSSIYNELPKLLEQDHDLTIEFFHRTIMTSRNHARLRTVGLPRRRLSAEFRYIALRSERPDWVISTFGPTPFRGASTPSLSNCAYSNLFYPELDFWKGDSFYRARKGASDRLRLAAVLREDIVTFETCALAERAKGLYPRAKSRFEHLPPARDLNLEGKLAETPRTGSSRFRVLLFSGHHPNKNWRLLPAIAEHLGSTDFEIVLTADPNLESVARIVDEIRRTGVGARAIGPVSLEDRAAVLSSVDCLMLLSNLESFSNNVYEAWAARIPLVITDADWAHSAAGNAAVYVTLEDPAAIAERLIDLSANERDREVLTIRGAARLDTMPTQLQRLSRLLSLLR